MKRVFFTIQEFIIPTVIFISIFVYLSLNFLNLEFWGILLAYFATILGSYTLFQETITAIFKKQFALDYIAILAVVLSLITGQYLVALILALMISGGRNLEDFAQNQAKKSLTALIERIPDKVTLWENGYPGEEAKIKNIRISQEIFIKKGEVIPLDGKLITAGAVLDESSLTGEADFVEKQSGDQIYSGTVNMGGAIAIRVSKTLGNSTYNKIIELVKAAQEEKSPLVRLADKYSTYFTITTFIIAGFAYVSSNFDLMRVLSVLAIATPCPLIIATPIALLGGVNAAAKKRIIVKRLSSLEALAKIDTLVFDKTGTITIGKPKLKNVNLLSKDLSQKEVLAIAWAIERNSLHPLAKSIISKAKDQKTPVLFAKEVNEEIGVGISGLVDNKKYTLSKLNKEQGMAIVLKSEKKDLAIFEFEDEIKENSKKVISFFRERQMQLLILTGDKKQAAESLVKALGEDVEIKAEVTPEEKLKSVKDLQTNKKIVAMVGDGINDAPALAAANVGIVFSNEEQTAASEAADIVFLGGEFASIPASYKIAKGTINIAMQSIIGGIGLSVLGMVFASVGLITPVFGAGIQEVIDVAVILNAIRASRISA